MQAQEHSFQAARASNTKYEGQNKKKIWGKGAQIKQKQFRNKQDISKPMIILGEIREDSASVNKEQAPIFFFNFFKNIQEKKKKKQFWELEKERENSTVVLVDNTEEIS